MGAELSHASGNSLKNFFTDTKKTPLVFYILLSGYFGEIGEFLLTKILKQLGIDVKSKYNDCGLLLYDREKQDVHAGASGCGCSAAVLCSYLLPRMREGKLKNLLFMATGALLSPTTVQQKESIPGIAHLIWFSSEKGGN